MPPRRSLAELQQGTQLPAVRPPETFRSLPKLSREGEKKPAHLVAPAENRGENWLRSAR
ncbi:MAG: hypothetical protein RL077_4448 [Verrucomicrobiota bacterium]|jgi:hypothetical protein